MLASCMGGEVARLLSTQDSPSVYRVEQDVQLILVVSLAQVPVQLTVGSST